MTYKPHNYPKTRHGTPLPPPLGKGLPGDKPLLDDRALERIEKSGIFIFLIIITGLELLIWAWVAWAITGNLDLRADNSFSDFIWMSGIAIFAVKFSKAISRHNR
jgi:hypothetical protein